MQFTSNPSAPRSARFGLFALVSSLFLGLAACGGSGGGGGTQIGPVGELLAKPGGGSFFVDPNEGGAVSRLRLSQMFWGRLVDVYDIDPATGEPGTVPVFRDFVISENLQSDGADYVLETNAITQRTRLIIQQPATPPATPTGGSTFASLLSAAAANLPPISPSSDAPTATQPVSYLSRNCAVVLRFNDALDDRPSEATSLADSVRVLTGYPPTNAFSSRIFFDPNHGTLVDGAFHSTRVIVDLTVSDAELPDLIIPVGVNSLGLPASLTSTGQPNVSIRIPTRIDAGTGQFSLLKNIGGKPLATQGNGPVDFTSPTVPIVRGMRSGNPTDANNGFLLDLEAPQVVSGWPIALTSAVPDPSGTAGFDFIVGIRFNNVCREQPRQGDILEMADELLEVTRIAGAPNGSGQVSDVRVRVLGEDTVVASTLLGNGTFQTTYDPGLAVDAACWFTFLPEPANPPSTAVDPDSQIVVRFNEPMDPLSVRPFDSFLVVKGSRFDEADATNIVVSKVQRSANLKNYSYRPSLEFEHQSNQAETFNIRLVDGERGPTDLAGNELRDSIPFVEFQLDPSAPEARGGGIVLRFDDINEFDVDDPDQLQGNLDIRGQFFYDFDRGLIRPRPVTHEQVPHDRTNPVPGKMFPFALPIQTPLTPLGARMTTLWRYCDMGWLVTDESKYNVDVEGLNWAPFQGRVSADSYEEFEIMLAHSRWLPDEYVDMYQLPLHRTSGLEDNRANFDTFPLDDPVAGPKVVHNRALGYTIRPGDIFVSPTGTQMMPYPFNRSGGPYMTYTWRDTSATGTGAMFGAGIPLEVEVLAPLNLYGGPDTGLMAGELYGRNRVPTIGLPLLMEVRCYPSDEGVGLNGFDVSLAINSSAEPNFRAFSQGGLDENFNQVFVNPDDDFHRRPRGGFNPGSNPPGRPTRRKLDNTFYIGQIDIVTRVSRVHTIFLNTQSANPEYKEPVVEPDASEQPNGTQLVLDYRGASAIVLGAEEPFDASGIDPYGNPWDESNSITFLNDVRTWTDDIEDVSGAPYIQVRVTFVNNLDTGLNPELSAIGIPFQSL